ncbi:MBOAT family protein [Bradyrhizobium sediminis]|uniref:Probable alginate O-acetylase AlgI n=1 Tax=Bradyrhizobium sediminis TaxID=2840469 RepID=A0A975RWH5_9BRAD|nr:MBOAT family O-acyltransferase [Bradyrhizobium sediminis]QWG22289.1 MBOAT family protein [Bradyrhizobium sediminis]
MLFTSLGFFAFLPLAWLLFSAMPVTQRWAVLLLVSYLFYGIWQPFNLVYLGVVTLAVYGCGWALERTVRPAGRKAWMAIGLVALLGSLVIFKFYDFIAGELERSLTPTFPMALPRLGVSTPVGYSFYAFSASSYLIDVYARRLGGGHHPGRVALYVAYFPKIFAGPIERATAFLPQLVAGLRADPGRAILGLQLIGWGLFKKVVIADNLAPLVDRNFGIVAFASPIELLVSVYFFAFQIYCDFSGYTDIAIGVSLLFGLQLMENFRRPYLSRSTAEFWGERWHISLGRWFRDYLYIPLGGSRSGPLRRYVNIMLVFTVSGLWHAGLGYGVGWTFVIWGALNGAYQWAGLATRGLWERLGGLLPALRQSAGLTLLRIVLTFHLIAISWIFFRARSVNDALIVIRKIGTNLLEIPSLVIQFPFTSEHGIGFGLIACLLAVETLDERRPIVLRLAAAPAALRWGSYYLVIFGLLILGRWQAKEFIYMQF